VSLLNDQLVLAEFSALGRKTLLDRQDSITTLREILRLWVVAVGADEVDNYARWFSGKLCGEVEEGDLCLDPTLSPGNVGAA
jgi:hypothetical protein